MPLVGIGLAAWGVLRAPWAELPETEWLGWLLLVVGLAAALLGGGLCWVNVDYFGNRHAYRSTRAVIGNRPDALVVAGDADAHFVDVVPRAQWHQVVPDQPAERGLLLVDVGRRQLVFEGMKERYVVPADAVLACDVEPMMPHTGAWNLFAVVLTVRYSAAAPAPLVGGLRGDEWEIPFQSRRIEFRRYSAAYRRGLAESLATAIRKLQSGSAHGWNP